MGASVLTAAALLFTWGRDATWINSNERRKQPLNAVLEIVPIIVPPRKNLSVSTTGILNRDKQVEEILSHVFPVCQLAVSNVLACENASAVRRLAISQQVFPPGFKNLSRNILNAVWANACTTPRNALWSSIRHPRQKSKQITTSLHSKRFRAITRLETLATQATFNFLSLFPLPPPRCKISSPLAP